VSGPVVASTPPAVAGTGPRTVLQFVAMGLIWGASFLFIKVALTGVSFGQVAWARAVLGGLTLAIIFVITRQKLPREPVVWLHFTVMAIVFCVLPYLLFAWAEQSVSSSLASIYNAVTPITTALIATLGFRVEKLTTPQVIGIVLGIAGVLVIIAPWQAGVLGGSLAGQLACLGAVTCYGFALSYQRRFLAARGIPGLTSATLNIGLAGAIFLLLTPIVAWQPVRLDFWVVGSLVLLGALGTGLAYAWNYAVLAAWGPTRTSTVTYVTPLVGVALGFLLLGERLSWHEPLGALVVLLGILLTQGRLRVGRRPRQAA
jgi:drug/metabolite transporter (DMT)-like permease